jgi:hypothetical protein
LPNVGVTIHLQPEESTSTSAHTQESMNLAFANQDDEDVIYPLTTREIAEAQKHDIELNTMTDKYSYTTQLVEYIKVLCKDGKMAIPTNSNKHTTTCSSMVSPLPSTPRNTHLEETFQLLMYWKLLQKTV